jgi:hypothetical protein
MHLLNEEKRWLGLLMVQREQYFLLVGDKLFIQYLLLFQRLRMREEVLGLVEEVKILYYLIVEMLYLGLLVLMGEVSFQIPQ